MIILLDFDGTLVHQHRELAFDALVKSVFPVRAKKKSARSRLEALAARLYKTDIYLCSHEIYDRRYLFRFFATELGDKPPEQLCRRFWKEVRRTQKPHPHCAEVLAGLRKKSHVLVCATDTDGFGGNKLRRIRASKLAGFFDHIFIGREKPVAVKRIKGSLKFIRSGKPLPPKGERLYIETIVRTLRKTRRKNECVMVGDKPKSDLMPAWGAGISTILSKTPEFQSGRAAKNRGWPVWIESIQELPGKLAKMTSGVFVSYAHQDAGLVKEIEMEFAKEFSGKDITLWIDKRKLEPGVQWEPTIIDALKSLPIFLIVMTPYARHSKRVRDEVEQARRNKDKIILPFLLKGKPLPELTGLQYVDGRRNRKAAIKRLMKRIRSFFAKSDISGDFQHDAFPNSGTKDKAVVDSLDRVFQPLSSLAESVSSITELDLPTFPNLKEPHAAPSKGLPSAKRIHSLPHHEFTVGEPVGAAADSDLKKMAMVPALPPETPSEFSQARRFQAQVLVGDAPPPEATMAKAFVKGQPHTIRAFIGPLDVRFLSLPWDESLLPPSSTGHTLHVVFIEPSTLR